VAARAGGRLLREKTLDLLDDALIEPLRLMASMTVRAFWSGRQTGENPG